jgi:hypothetical protein
MLGTYAVEGDALIFRPRFPLAPGMGYRGSYQGGGFVMDAPPVAIRPAARVEHVYPSTDVLPANTLRLYLYFSASMSQGEAWQHIHLLDDNGAAVPFAFLELDQELWDPGNQRLTVLFDPGRIKRGVLPANEPGPPLTAGKRYRLAIDKDWRDAHGATLVEGFEKTFAAGVADRTPPDPKSWRVSAPKAGSLEPLSVEFPKPMDYALLQRMLEIPGVRGTVTVDRNETRWRFTPEARWRAGSYRLIADNKLEDISGNHLDRPFDAEIVRRPDAARPVAIRFQVH